MARSGVTVLLCLCSWASQWQVALCEAELVGQMSKGAETWAEMAITDVPKDHEEEFKSTSLWSIDSLIFKAKVNLYTGTSTCNGEPEEHSISEGDCVGFPSLDGSPGKDAEYFKFTRCTDSDSGPTLYYEVFRSEGCGKTDRRDDLYYKLEDGECHYGTLGSMKLANVECGAGTFGKFVLPILGRIFGSICCCFLVCGIAGIFFFCLKKGGQDRPRATHADSEGVAMTTRPSQPA